MQEMQVQSRDQEDPLEKEMATHSSILAWEIPWTEESGGLQYIGSQRLRHDLVTKQQQQQHFLLKYYSTHTHTHIWISLYCPSKNKILGSTYL